MKRDEEALLRAGKTAWLVVTRLWSLRTISLCQGMLICRQMAECRVGLPDLAAGGKNPTHFSAPHCLVYCQ